ncbi:hypothetical protein [Nocardiopsis nanhaiensis]
MKIQGKPPLTSENPIIDLGNNLRVPTSVNIQGSEVNGYDVTMRADYSSSSGRYECRALTVTAPQGVEITGEALRSVPVQAVLNMGVASALQGFTTLNMGAIPGDITEGGPTTRALEWVAYLYKVALIFGESPVQAVAHSLELPKSTANRWITRARDRGILNVQDKRGRRDQEDDT